MVLDILAPLGPVSAKRLFGTWGLYLEDRIFALVHDGVVYFRTSSETLPRYVQAGARAFRYRRRDGSSTVLQYHEVPAHVLEQPELARAWAHDALRSASG